VICLAGFTIGQKLSIGKHLYIDDFVTDKSLKSTDSAKALLDFLKIYAKQQNCKSIHLDSLVQRHDAHKFYLSEDMEIDSHHFSFKL
jgi:GNAT superfamily N-acetyltransferase